MGFLPCLLLLTLLTSPTFSTKWAMSQCSISQDYLPENESKYANYERPALALVPVGTDAVVSAFYDTRPLLFMRTPEVVVVGSLQQDTVKDERHCLIARERKRGGHTAMSMGRRVLELEVLFRNVMRVVYSKLSGWERRRPCMFSCAIDIVSHFRLFSSQKDALYVALVVKNASTDTWVKVWPFSNHSKFLCAAFAFVILLLFDFLTPSSFPSRSNISQITRFPRWLHPLTHMLSHTLLNSR